MLLVKDDIYRLWEDVYDYVFEPDSTFGDINRIKDKDRGN